MAELKSKAERLAVASAIAPVLRATSEATKRRRVAVVDAEGNVVGYRTLAEVQEKLLEAKKLELEVDDGVRPKELMCRQCGSIFIIGSRGPQPGLCNGCKRGRCVQCKRVRPSRPQDGKPNELCAGCLRDQRRQRRADFLEQVARVQCIKCGGAVGRSAGAAAVRNGRPATCRRCFLGDSRVAVLPRCTSCSGEIAYRTAWAAKKAGYQPRCQRCYLAQRVGDHIRQ